MPGLADLAVDRDQCERADAYRRRKDTAVLAIAFADVAGSTALLEELGENRYDDLREAHNQRVRAIVEEEDAGFVVQFYGDGALAVISEPSTAVERCLRLVGETELRSPLRLRIGIDVGQVARKRREGTVLEVFGRHVNRASRIGSLAEPGQVLVSYSVYDFSVGWLRGLGVEWEAHGLVTPRGFSDAVSIHEPLRPGTERPRTSNESLLRLTGDGAEPPAAERRGTVMYLSAEKSRMTRLAQPEGSDPLLETALADRPPSAVGAREDPLGHYVRALASKAAALRRSPRRRVRALLRRCAGLPTVLWVDDYPENNRILQALIEDCGCRVLNATDTDAAMASLRAAPVDLVITDMGRGQDPTAGLDLLSRMRDAELRKPSAVFASPRAVAEHGPDALGLGAIICTSGTVRLFEFLTRELR